jgi:hypothetical protein
MNTKPSTTLLEINSLDRNISKYPNPANYRVNLEEQLRNVTKITLVGGTIPVNNYTIHEFNSSFDVSYGGTQTAVTLTQGNYSLSELATELESVLQTDVDAGFSVSSNSITEKLTISHSSATFQLIFTTYPRNTVIDVNTGAYTNIRNAAIVLGFDPNTDYTAVSDGGGGFELVAPYPVHLMPVKRIYMYLNADHTNSYSNVRQVRRRKQLFGVIYVNTEDIVILNEDMTRFFSQTYGGQDILYMDLEFRDEFGNLYNFQNKNHTLLLRIDVNTPTITPNIPPPMILPEQGNMPIGPGQRGPSMPSFFRDSINIR